MTARSPEYLIFGKLTREYMITPDNKVFIDQPGGNLLFAAGGAGLWLKKGETLGLVSRVGEDYPRKWLEDLAAHGFNTDGINILPEAVDLRQFIAYTDLRTKYTTDPVSHFARLQLTFPKTLLGYQGGGGQLDSTSALTAISIRQSDLPQEYQYARMAHFCYIDYLTHNLMPMVLRQLGLEIITLDPSPGYMHHDFWDKLPSLMPGLTAFIPSEEDLRELFKRRSEDLNEMCEAVADWGCEYVVVKRGEHGQLLYNKSTKNFYEIPAYPSRMIDLHGVGDAFCGGFLVGYKRTLDALQAVLHGNVSASICVEGSGAFYARDVLPGLAQARLENLRDSVRKI